MSKSTRVENIRSDLSRMSNAELERRSRNGSLSDAEWAEATRELYARSRKQPSQEPARLSEARTELGRIILLAAAIGTFLVFANFPRPAFGVVFGIIGLAGLWTLEDKGARESAGLLCGALAFVASWIGAVASWGFLLGVGFGWIPAAVVAFLTYWVGQYVWPFAFLLIAYGLLFLK